MKTLFAIFPYVGSKARLMPQLIRLFPPHTLYVSVFGGSGTDILHKPRSQAETFNDLDKDICNVFMVLQDDEQRTRLIEKINFTPIRSLAFYQRAVRQIKASEGSPVERAWAFLYAAHQALFRMHPSLLGESGWEYGPCRSSFRRVLRLVVALEDAARRFRQVRLTCWDWRRVITTFDSPDTLFYMDPPYYPITLEKRYYKVQMTESDHREMLEVIQHVKGYVMISGYDSPLYQDKLSHWGKKTFRKRVTAAVTAVRKPERVEVVWMNYQPDGIRIGR